MYIYSLVSLNKYLLVICCLVHCIWKSWASNKLWPHLIYLTNCSPEVTAFFSLSSTSSSSSTGSSSLSLLSFSSNFLEVSFLAGLPRGRVPGVICGCWGWAWPKIIVENYYQKLVCTNNNIIYRRTLFSYVSGLTLSTIRIHGNSKSR